MQQIIRVAAIFSCGLTLRRLCHSLVDIHGQDGPRTGVPIWEVVAEAVHVFHRQRNARHACVVHTEARHRKLALNPVPDILGCRFRCQCYVCFFYYILSLCKAKPPGASRRHLRSCLRVVHNVRKQRRSHKRNSTAFNVRSMPRGKRTSSYSLTRGPADLATI